MLAIFDLDGTLLNTLEDLAAACNYALDKNGFSGHPAQSYKLFVGAGAFNLVMRALPEGAGEAAIAAVRSDFGRYYSAHAMDLTQPYDGVCDMLRGIRCAGISVAVLSNKPDENTGVLVAKFFPDLVDLAYGQRAHVPIKPDPAAVFEIMAHFGAKAADCLYIGDSGVDMQTAHNAEVFAIGVDWGFRTREELAEHGAMCIVDKVCVLEKFIIDKLTRCRL